MNSRITGDYEIMMSDSVRMRAYHRAINAVCGGKTVCEIGVGLGPLTMMALQAGATRVYGIEADSDVLMAAKRVIRDNGFGPDRFVPIEGLSIDVELPERVDVILCELFDSTGFAENVVTFAEDARMRFLKPDGVLLPRRLDCYVALAKPSAYDEHCRFWLHWLMDEFGLDYSAIMERVRSDAVTIAIGADELVSDWECWLHVDFAHPENNERCDPVLLQVRDPSVVTGAAMVFDVELSEGVHIRTFPEDPVTHWRQGFSPFTSPVACRADDCLWLDVIAPISDTPYLKLRTRNLHLRGSAALKLMADLEERRRTAAPAGPRGRASVSSWRGPGAAV